MPPHRDLLLAAAALVLLPFALGAIGLGITSASEVVIFAMACMALNILVGYTGLVSFGHGAWFGLAAYAAAMAQRELFKGSFLLPAAIGVAVVLLAAFAFGFLILRRRGVYFSLLTLALSATCMPSRISTPAVSAKASASFFFAKVFCRRVPLPSA